MIFGVLRFRNKHFLTGNERYFEWFSCLTSTKYCLFPWVSSESSGVLPKLIKSLFLILIMLSMNFAYAQVYGTRPTGHEIVFLIVTDSHVTLESYRIQAKISPSLITRNIKTYKIGKKTDNAIYAEGVVVSNVSKGILRIQKDDYYEEIKIEKIGDFSYLDSNFGNLSNVKRIEICRAYYNRLKKRKGETNKGRGAYNPIAPPSHFARI